MQIGLMVPAQFGLNWERWLHILELAERLDFHSVFRSDHYFSGAQEDSLEAYVSLAVAAQVTERVRFGPMVSPVTFRHPVDVGRMAAQIDILSGGRFVLGVGAGWPAPEYEAYGLPSPPLGERFDRLAEALEVMRALWRAGTHSFAGRYYQLHNVDCLPKPAHGRPEVLIGGAGERRTLRLVAEQANEWNAVNLGPDQVRHKIAVLERHCQDVDRDPAEIRHSVDLFALIGPSDDVVRNATRRYMSMFGAGEAESVDDFLPVAEDRGVLVGSSDRVVQHLGELSEAGIHEVIFQHLLMDDDAVPQYLASEIMPQVNAF